jgi:ribA/ribD-fused uncharacterized protein
MRYNLQWLKNKISSGEPVEYLFFYGHTPPKDGSIDKSCLSQWYDAPFLGVATAEHYMMSEKAYVFGDIEIYEKILKSKCPREAKALGRLVKDYIDEVWNEEKFRRAVYGNFVKFSSHDKLEKFLLSTGDKVLVEASPYDKIWGIGLGITDPRNQNPDNWTGENLLGFALMEARDMLS